MAASERADVYTRITSEIVAAIEQGAGDWRMPWHHDGSHVARPQNVLSSRPYRGVNVIALWVAAFAGQHASGNWGTYRQWRELGAQVRKGERSTTVVLWKELNQTEEQARDEEDGRRRMFAKAFYLFNAGQVEGWSGAEPASPLPSSERLAQADAFHAALNISTVNGSESAHYRILEDRIHMPDFQRFHEPVGYYGTLLHEAAHATGAKHRLDRDFSKRFSRETLAMEEMTAELTAAMVLAGLGIAHHPRPDHAAYVASWLRALKDDPRAVFTAASRAQAASDWMWARQGGSAQVQEAA